MTNVSDEGVVTTLPTTEPRRSQTRRASGLARAALACAVIGLPLCLWLFAALMSTCGPDRVFEALWQANHNGVGLVVELALATGPLLSLLGAGLGLALVLWGRRRDAVPRPAGLALCVGSAGLLAVCTALAVCFAVNAVLIIEGPGPAIITVVSSSSYCSSTRCSVLPAVVSA